jgi:hypothetical protein
MYVERYVPAEAGPAELARDTGDGLKGLIEVALELSQLKEFLGTDQPTVITVRSLVTYICRGLKITFYSNALDGNNSQKNVHRMLRKDCSCINMNITISFCIVATTKCDKFLIPTPVQLNWSYEKGRKISQGLLQSATK